MPDIVVSMGITAVTNTHGPCPYGAYSCQSLMRNGVPLVGQGSQDQAVHKHTSWKKRQMASDKLGCGFLRHTALWLEPALGCVCFSFSAELKDLRHVDLKCCLRRLSTQGQKWRGCHSNLFSSPRWRWQEDIAKIFPRL